MGWMEDTITFRGAIRRSGNSLVTAIPADLSQRFPLRKGQEFLIYGLSRKNPDFEEVLQIYLGYFVAHEKAPALILRVEAKAEELRRIQEIIGRLREKYLLLTVNLSKLSESEVEIALIFSASTLESIRRVGKLKEVEDAAAELEYNLSSQGFKVLEKKVEDKIIEWRKHGFREALESPI